MPNFVFQGLGHYKLSDFKEVGDVWYLGYITALGAWYITKIDMGSDPRTARYCKGDSGYDFSDPASLTYDTFDNIF